MRAHDLPRRLLRATMILIAVGCAAALTPLHAQQAADSARVLPASSAQPSTPSTALQGPRLAPRFERVEPALTSRNASVAAPLPIASGRHTIVLSTLSLVLIVVIVVLLLH